MPKSVGQKVKVRGVEYTIIKILSSAHLGSKFFGKFKFFLRDRDGNVVSAYGKTVGSNSGVRPIQDYERKEYGL